MNRIMLKSKIHRAVVTDADLNYTGSISIGKELCLAAEIVEFEKVDIYNITNGERFSTYVIFGKEGEITLNGAAARKVQKGDLIIIASYAVYADEEARSHRPKLVFVNSRNVIERISRDD